MLNSVGAIYDYNRARNNEHKVNKYSTAAGLGTLAAGSLTLQYLSNKNPEYLKDIQNKTGKYVENAQNYIKNQYSQAVNSEKGKEIIEQIKQKYSELKKTDLGSKITEKFNSIAEKIKSDKSVKKIIKEIDSKWHKFTKGRKFTKGKYALVAAGIGIVSYVAHKLISNYYKKEGAIDQKYQDMRVMDNYLV